MESAADFTSIDDAVFSRADASQSSSLDPRQFGSLVHEVFEHCDLADPQTIPELCRVLAQQRFPQLAEQAAREASEVLLPFLDSSRGREIATAPVVYRELEFLLRWPLQQSTQDADEASKMLTGFIDVLYADRHGAYHLVDLKTNAISDEQLASAAARYQLQLSLYALAAERILAEPPVDLTLSFLRPQKEVNLPWDDESRERTIDRLNREITQTVLSS